MQQLLVRLLLCAHSDEVFHQAVHQNRSAQLSLALGLTHTLE